MPRVVRMMAHVETDLPRADITHVYLHGAAALRRDLTRVRAVPDDEVDELTGPVLVVGAGPARHLGRRWRCARRGVDVALRGRQRTSTSGPPPAWAPAHPTRTPVARGWSSSRSRRTTSPSRSPRRCATPTPSSPTSAASRAPPLAQIAGRGRRPAGRLRRQPPDGRQRALRAAGRHRGALRRPALGGHPARPSAPAASRRSTRAGPAVRRDRRSRLSPEEHDQAVARTSHLPHLLAVLVAGRLTEPRASTSRSRDRESATSPGSRRATRPCGSRSSPPTPRR